MIKDRREQFPATSECTYLNTGTLGLIPETIRERVRAMADRYYRLGPVRPDVSGPMREEYDRTRGRVASLLGAEPDEVALLQNTTEGINAVVHGLDLEPGDEVVVTDLEHPAGRITWELLARKRGIKVVPVASSRGTVTADDLVGAFTPRTKVLSISHVTFTTAAVLPVEEVCAEARRRGVFSVLDGAQAAGVLNFTPRQLGCDAYAFPGYKWTLGPEGTGGFWVRRESWDRLTPHQIAGRGARTRDMDGSFEPWPGPRGFETATANYMAYITLGLSADYLNRLGMERIESHARTLCQRFVDGLESVPGADVITPRDAVAGMVAFTVEGPEPADLVKRLWEGHRVVIRSVPRPRALRASFHLYNTGEDVDRLLDALMTEIRRP